MKLATVSLVEVKDVQEAPWNVNVQSPDIFSALKRDMEREGAEGTGPIDTCILPLKDPAPSKSVGKFTCDGSNRLKAAKELGWKYLQEIFHPEIKTEEDARLFNYRRDFDRGTVDRFKLAESYGWFRSRGKTQEEISKLFGVHEATVSRTLSLLQVDPEVKKQLTTNTEFTVSHIEPIAILPPAQQRAVAHELQRRAHYNLPTVKDVESEVKQVKAWADKQSRFESAVARAKFPTCPVKGCGRKANVHGWKDPPMAKCESGTQGHVWNLNTGETEMAEMARKSVTSGHKAPAVDYFRSVRTTDDFQDLFSEISKDVLPRFESIETLTIRGRTKDGKSATMDLSDSFGIRFYVRGPGLGAEYALSVEGKKYDAKRLKDFHTVVRGDGKRGKALEELEKEVSALFVKYGKLPHGKKDDA